MRVSRSKAVLAVGAALALVMSGCGSSDSEDEASGGELRYDIGEPESLIPTHTNESNGSTVLQALYTGLINYDAKTKEPVNVIADSIESEDQKVWTIKMKEGFTFHNGEPVNADAFIRAWNYGAFGPNAQGNSYFFDRIVGYADLQSKDPDGKEGPLKAPAPKTDKLSGLEKVSDTEIKVTLTNPFSGFPLMLGYTAFVPLADACLKDMKACGEAPIGNGPFKLEGKWEHKQRIDTVRFDDYKGDKAQLDKLSFRIYDKVDTAYQDFVAGNIDMLDTTPPEKYTEAKQQFGERLIEEPTSQFTYVGLPSYVTSLQDKKIRQALSLAIDREAIVKNVLNGRFAVAKSVVSPVVPGSRTDACKHCDYDPAKAKTLLAEAGGWKGGKIQLWFNAGSGHDVWMQAVGDQLKKNLGIDYEFKGSLQFAEYGNVADEKKFTGPFRLGWLMDYPSPENYLKPLYGTQGSSNNTSYSNKAVDDLITKGDGASSLDAGIKEYQAAEDLVLEDLPVLPMWFGKSSTIYSDKVGGVEYNVVDTNPDFAKLTIKK